MNDTEFQQKVVSLSKNAYLIAVRLLRSEEDAKDAVQEVMIKLWDKRKKLEKHPNIKGFLFLTTRNYCLDLIQTSKWKFKNANEKIENLPLILSEQNESNFIEERYQKIKTEIDHLPEIQKQIILLRDFDGFDFEEIAKITNLKVEHIRVLLSRTRKKIREQLTKTENNEQKTS